MGKKPPKRSKQPAPQVTRGHRRTVIEDEDLLGPIDGQVPREATLDEIEAEPLIRHPSPLDDEGADE